MVIETMSVLKTRRAAAALAADADVIVLGSSSSDTSKALRPRHPARLQREDVIDLGAPRLQRRHAAPRRRFALPYTPNPRLYPGPQPKPKTRPNRAEARGKDGRGRRRKRVLRRAVPNPRLYRPPPPRPPPPPANPRTHWAPPEPPAILDTASYVALRLSEQRRGTRLPQRTATTERSKVRAAHSTVWAVRVPAQAARSPARTARSPRSPVRAARTPARKGRSLVRAERLKTRGAHSLAQAAHSPVWVEHLKARAALSPAQTERVAVRARAPPPPREQDVSPPRRLVLSLPGGQARRYRPASEYFRLHSLDTDSSASTAAAALAGARAPQPGAAMDASRHSTSPEDCSESNETQSAPSEFLAEFLSAIMRRQYAEALKYCRLILQYEPHNATARGFYPLLQHKVQAHRQAEQGWARGSSSEEASAHTDQQLSAPGAQEMMEQGGDEGLSRSSSCSQSSLELDSSESPSVSLGHSAHSAPSAHSASPGCWDSTGSEPDDNGNAPAAAAADLHTDNAAPHKGESAASLRRLRAQFTCSIK
ncbi:hypothetical protein PYW08_016173 [Mythimna loreyi]|uniref:Uncharacterized protein n=1 Tax=Mythimna loreyi TaxID=667449 RepID=A0ACC2QSR1_9NEOP|nr:hypothetical protein PYW08_016173 [Mythimna loreyi]